MERGSTVDSTQRHGRSEVGTPRPRREDRDLVAGRAPYTDDITAPGTVHASMCRSQYAHARIESVDTSAAEARDDVLAVYTAADVAESQAEGAVDGIEWLGGQRTMSLPLLADEVARYAGEPIAVVVAEDRYGAAQAADLIEVSYDRLDAVTDPREALADDAPLVHEDLGDNRVFETTVGTPEAVDEAFEAADRAIELDLENRRLIPNAMEPRATFAEYDGDRLTVRLSTQTPHGARDRIAQALDLSTEEVHVDAPATGGGFGSKGNPPYPDEPLTAWCAHQLGQPVKWVATRTVSHRTDHHGRGVFATAELAVDDDGSIRGIRVDATFDVGAYPAGGSAGAMNFQRLVSGQYEIPAVAATLEGAFTNTAPTGPYRGAGRPEAIYIIERIVDHAAQELEMDPVEFRRRNLIDADAFPYETPLGFVYDSGDYEKTLDMALDQVDYESFREQQERAREEGRYLGLGVCCLVENSGGGAGSFELGRVAVDPSGEVTVYCGTFDHGQGHRTAFPQLIADELGVPYEDVTLEDGDTDDLPDGTGTFASRSAAVGGSALVESAREVRERARQIAAHHLEAPEADVEFEGGDFFASGAPDRSVSIQEVASLAGSGDLPADVDADLDETITYSPDAETFPFGTHLAVVEVNAESGEIDILRYVAVDDCGVQLNPLIVEGQVHGSVAQGVGQALYEEAVYDDNGTLITGSLQDYAMPKAEHVPEIETEDTVTPAPNNPVGAKGAGESGTIAAPPALVNAVVDALEPFGVDHLDMPLTAERVWQAVRES